MITVNICSYSGRFIRQLKFNEAPQVGDFVEFRKSEANAEVKSYRVANRRWPEEYDSQVRAVSIELEGLI